MIKFEIIQEKSLYGNMHFHLIGTMETGGKISTWYKTKKEALYNKDKQEKEQEKNKYIFYK